MYRNLKFLLESYGEKEPTYFGPPERKEAFMKWLKRMKHEVHEDGSVSVEGNVDMSSMGLGKIPFKFKVVTGDFCCSFNNLTSLKGSPKEVGGDFACSFDNLTSLEGAPEVIKGKFRSAKFSDKAYRKFVKEREINRKLNKKLSKDFSEDALKALDDFS